MTKLFSFILTITNVLRFADSQFLCKTGYGLWSARSTATERPWSVDAQQKRGAV